MTSGGLCPWICQVLLYSPDSMQGKVWIRGTEVKKEQAIPKTCRARRREQIYLTQAHSQQHERKISSEDMTYRDEVWLLG